MRPIFLILILLSRTCIAASVNEPSVGVPNEQTCDTSTLDIVGKFLGHADFTLTSKADDPIVIAAAACKTSPAAPEITIAAVAYDNGEDDAKATIIALVNQAERRVVASTRGEITEDAAMRIEPGSLRVDTAAYTLAPGIRAFGVDVTSGYIVTDRHIGAS